MSKKGPHDAGYDSCLVSRARARSQFVVVRRGLRKQAQQDGLRQELAYHVEMIIADNRQVVSSSQSSFHPSLLSISLCCSFLLPSGVMSHADGIMLG